jgi:hypothetical protein
VASELVTKQEILDQVWPGMALEQGISLLLRRRYMVMLRELSPGLSVGGLRSNPATTGDRSRSTYTTNTMGAKRRRAFPAERPRWMHFPRGLDLSKKWRKLMIVNVALANAI